MFRSTQSFWQYNYFDVLFKQGFNFRGVMSRSHFWAFVGLDIAFSLLLLPVAIAFSYAAQYTVELFSTPHFDIAAPATHSDLAPSDIFVLLFLLWQVITFIPGLAATARRLQDAGHSRFWILGSWLPIITLVVLILLLLPSKKQKNL